MKDGDRLVVVRPDRVGDVIISSSVLPSLRAVFPNSDFFFMASPVMEPLFYRHSLLAGFVALPTPGSLAGEMAAWLRIWRELKPAAVVFLHPDRCGYVAAWWAGIPVRMGWAATGWNWTLSHRTPDWRKQGLRHEGSYNFEVLKKALPVIEPVELRAVLSLNPDSESAGQSLLPWKFGEKRFVVINPTAFSPVARWAPERFVELAVQLQARYAWSIVVIGAAAEDPSVVEVMRMLAGRGMEAINLAGRTNLAELGGVLRRAEMLITRDTGPSHLAAAVDCPVVVIFGRSTPLYGPVRWKPLGSRVEVVTAPVPRYRRERNVDYWRRCFDAISVEQVVVAVEKIRGSGLKE